LFGFAGNFPFKLLEKQRNLSVSRRVATDSAEMFISVVEGVMAQFATTSAGCSR
jgi:hypothetical protein